jgi:lipase ATG15
VFATPDNSTVVLSIKGTSGGWMGGGGPTIKKDKFNDNLLFSCCCAYVDWTWTVSRVFTSPMTVLMIARVLDCM